MDEGQVSSGDIFVPYQELLEIGIQSLELVEVPTQDARMTVEMLLWADLRGVGTHGISRLLMYVLRLRKGLINPRPEITVDPIATALRIIHGDNGLGPLVATRGMREAIEVAKELGLSFVGCTDSNHFGAAAPYVLMACHAKMIGIAGTNASPTMAPWGGLARIVGNNPLAIGVPCDGDTPFILDMAMSVSSRGRIRQIAEREGKIPEGWALDSKGRPTNDPMEALKGFVLPIGSYKGYGLTVAIDLLSGVLTGSGFATGVKSLLQQWEEPQHVGHFFIVIDPACFMPWEPFSDRVRQMFSLLRSTPRIDPDIPIVVPGEPEAQLEKERRLKGIPLNSKLLSILKGLTQGNYDYEVPKY